MIEWTEERTERLKALWLAGWDSQRISDELGCTRSAALGKVHRIGLRGMQGLGNASRKPIPIKPVFEWTDERVAQLRVLAETTMSNAAIARLMGVAKSTLQGNMERLGIKRNAQAIAARRRAEELKHAHRTADPIEAKENNKQRARSDAAKFAALAEKDEAEHVGGVPLLAAGHGECRWPIGDPCSDGFQFCGHDTKAGSSYCAEHYGRAYVGLKPNTAAEIKQAQWDWWHEGFRRARTGGWRR